MKHGSGSATGYDRGVASATDSASSDLARAEMMEEVLLEIGSVCIITAGSLAGRACVVMEHLEEPLVLVECRGKSKKVNKRHLQQAEDGVIVSGDMSPDEVRALLEKVECETLIQIRRPDKVSGQQLCAIVERRGWVQVGTRGKVRLYAKAGCDDSLEIPVHGGKPLHIGVLRQPIQLAGLTEDEVLEEIRGTEPDKAGS